MSSPVLYPCFFAHADSLSVSRGKPGFVFDRRNVLLADCTVFTLKTSASEETVIPTAPLVVGFLDYDTVTRAREQRFAPDYSWPLNEPLLGWNKRKLRLCTPEIWNRDPYLLCVMLALAHYKWEVFESERYPVCFNHSIKALAKSSLGSSCCPHIG